MAPLTTALMGSVPAGRAALGSAINNAVSRVGQPLLSAVIFIVVNLIVDLSYGLLDPRIRYE